MRDTPRESVASFKATPRIPFLVFPPYLAQVLGGSFDLVLWMFVVFIGSLPWSIKAIVGPLSDKWGTKKYGRRLPWIAGFGYLGAFFWFLMAIYLPIDETIYMFFAIYFFLTQLGTSFSDTALDSLILDVTPKEKLGKIQGSTWTCMYLGMGAGGMLLGLIFLALNLIPGLFILTGILTIVACSLPYFVEEEPYTKIDTKMMSRDLISIASKKRNYKVFFYTFTGAIGGVIISTYFNYLVLIGMDVIDVTETLLSITSGSAVDLLGWSSVFYFFFGIGVVIGSMLTGKYVDKGRKKTVIKTYLIFMALCVITIIPFVLFDIPIVALIFGILIQVLLGGVQGAMTVSNQTVRGDLTKKYYPELKSTFYALLVALSNFGQSFGRLMGVLIFSLLVGLFFDFYSIYFMLSIFCTVTLAISTLLFKTIDPGDYELGSFTGEEQVELGIK